MGVLEEAIREHLELKRKHGASDEELIEKEAEALGPARREFEAPAEPASEDERSPEEEDAEPVAEEPLEPVPEDHPEPVVEERPPVADEGQGLDFEEESEPEPDHLWSEQKPPRDLDFD